MGKSISDESSARVLRPRLESVRSPRVRRTLNAALGTAIGSALGAVLPFVIARLVIPTSRADVYFLVAGASQLAAYLLANVIEGAVLPLAVQVLDVDSAGLRRFARNMVRNAMALAFPVTAGFVILSAVLLRTANLSHAQASDGIRLVIALVPLPLLVALTSSYSAISYARNRFASTTASQGLRAAGGLLGCLFVTGHIGTVAVGLGLSAGELCRGLLLRRTLPPSGPSPQRNNRWEKEARAHFFKSSTPLLAATIIVAFNPLVDKSVASHLGIGGVTLIELAEKLFYVPMVLLFSAVSIVSGVVWGHLGEKNLDSIAVDFWRVQRVGAALSLTIAVLAATLVLAMNSVVVGALGIDHRSPFGAVFALYIIGLPFALAQSLAGRLLIIMGRTGPLPTLAVGLVVLNLVADLIGASLFGIRGIAISSSAVRLINAVAFLVLVRRFFASAGE